LSISLSRVKATLMLCDAAQVADGKLYILGGGWSVTGPGPAPSAVAIRLEVQADEAAKPHHWELYLVDGNGNEVAIETPDGAQPIEIRGDFEVAQPEQLPQGMPIDVNLAMNIGPLPLPPGGRFSWQLTVDGESDPGWQAAFTTRVPETPEGPPSLSLV
jgi:hypothetical protein